MVRILVQEVGLVQVDGTGVVENVFRQAVQCFKTVHFHGLADGILSLNVRQGFAAHGEVLGDHAEISEPALVVALDRFVHLLERERGNSVREFVLCRDPSGFLPHIKLIIDHSNNHALQD